MPDHSANVARFLPAAAERTPDMLAVRAPAGRAVGGDLLYTDKTFAQLERESAATARLLHARGLRKGTGVLLLVKPGLNLIRITFALFKVGAVPVVIDPGMGLRHFLACVKHTRPGFMVGIPRAMILRHVFRRTFATLQHSLCVGHRFEHRVTGDDTAVFSTTAAKEQDLAAILFTSGSTGPPKGVCYTHGIFDAQVRLIRDAYGIQAGEIDLPMLPIFALFNPALGMTTVVPDMNPSRPATVDPDRIIRAIRQNGVTNSFGSPVLWRKIGRYCTEHKVYLPSMKRVLIAGASVSPELIRCLRPVMPKAEIHTPYGATEALPVSTLSGEEMLQDTCAKTATGAGSCLGKPFAGIEVRILPPHGRPQSSMPPLACAPGAAIGEICVSGPIVTPAYHDRPEATAAAKFTDPDGTLWHRMGDLGYVDADGRIWFCGRKVECVETQGHGYYTDCCEAVFNAHPDVFRAALIGVKHDGIIRPAIVVEPEAGKLPRTAADKYGFAQKLHAAGQAQPHTAGIRIFAFAKSFPVDVRHNAKIHRLTLARTFRAKHAVFID